MDRNTDSTATELLILAWRAGDEQAFTALHRRWNLRLAVHAGRLCRDVEQAADVLQETWLAIARGLDRLQDPARFPGWARGIIAHKAADRARKESRTRTAEQRAGERSELVESDTTGTEKVAADDEQDTLRNAIRQLPTTDRAVLSLFYLDELPIGEIADALAIPRGTVKSRLFHARQRLRLALQRKT